MTKHYKTNITIFVISFILMVFSSTSIAFAWGPITHFYINSEVGSPTGGIWDDQVFNANGTGPDIFTMPSAWAYEQSVRHAHAPIPGYYRDPDRESWNDKPNFAYLMWQVNGKDDRYSPAYNAAMGWGGHIAADWVAHDQNLFVISDNLNSDLTYHCLGELSYDYYVLLKYKRRVPITGFEYRPDLIREALINAELIRLRTNQPDETVLSDERLRQDAIDNTPSTATIKLCFSEYLLLVSAEESALIFRSIHFPQDNFLIPTPNGAETNLEMAKSSVSNWVRNPTAYNSIPWFNTITWNPLAYNVESQLFGSNVAYAAETPPAADVGSGMTPDEVQAQFWYRVGARTQALGGLQITEYSATDSWGEQTVKSDVTTLDSSVFNVAFQQIVDEDRQKPTTSPEYRMALFADRFVVDGQNEQRVLLDFTPPDIFSFTPQDGSVPDGLRPTISANVEDLPDATGYSGVDESSIVLKLDGTPVQAEYIPEINLVRYMPNSDLASGTHDVSLIVEDKAHNKAVKEWSFKIDPTPPQTNATLDPVQPNGANGWYTSGVTASLSAIDNEGGSGVSKTEYSLSNGETWATYMAPAVFSTEGINKILYRSTDMAGNTEEPKEVTFKIDKTAPAAPTVTAPPNGERGNGLVVINGQAEPFTTITVIVDGVAAYTTTVDLLGAWQTDSVLAAGSHAITVTATDDAGNVSAPSEPVNILVRYVTNLVSTDSITIGQYSDPVTVSASLSGDGGPLPSKEIVFSIGSQHVTSVTDQNGMASGQITLSQPAGTYELKTKFAEDDTYQGSSLTTAFTIEKEDIVVTYTGDMLASIVGAPTLKAQLTDADSGAPVADRNTLFTLGDQSLSAVSDPNGMSSCILVIAQPQGIYQAHASFAGDGYYKPAEAIPSYVVVYDPFSGQKATGGGWIMNGGGKCNFGFNAEYKSGATTPAGELLYKDHGNGTTIRSLSYAWLVFSGNTAALEGTCSLNGWSGYTFTLDISDIGEPGKDKDRFKLVVSSSQDAVVYTIDGVIIQGNIQIH